MPRCGREHARAAAFDLAAQRAEAPRLALPHTLDLAPVPPLLAELLDAVPRLALSLARAGAVAAVPASLPAPPGTVRVALPFGRAPGRRVGRTVGRRVGRTVARHAVRGRRRTGAAALPTAHLRAADRSGHAAGSGLAETAAAIA